jgi:hypothetical protein
MHICWFGGQSVAAYTPGACTVRGEKLSRSTIGCTSSRRITVSSSGTERNPSPRSIRAPSCATEPSSRSRFSVSQLAWSAPVGARSSGTPSGVSSTSRSVEVEGEVIEVLLVMTR